MSKPLTIIVRGLSINSVCQDNAESLTKEDVVKLLAQLETFAMFKFEHLV
ncbi:hypothetical protein H6G14_28635 [Nostoc parmelioides FACHB-3921]|uniref:Uncharacterized protein n=1 Tax=Nostoc parmelioides FACHB-3921 TaxID=2692909 RepID=A0ABR8BQK1_9NOSO|nr:hypothetical protein [Nostoc parmelioides FACHB-3921]